VASASYALSVLTTQRCIGRGRERDTTVCEQRRGGLTHVCFDAASPHVCSFHILYLRCLAHQHPKPFRKFAFSLSPSIALFAGPDRRCAIPSLVSSLFPSSRPSRPPVLTVAAFRGAQSNQPRGVRTTHQHTAPRLERHGEGERGREGGRERGREGE